MRVNVYAEEMTDRIEIISKTIDGTEAGRSLCKSSATRVMRLLWFVACLFGFHAPGKPHGEIHIYRLDRDRHAIEYGNVIRCARCKKKLGIDNSH